MIFNKIIYFLLERSIYKLISTVFDVNRKDSSIEKLTRNWLSFFLPLFRFLARQEKTFAIVSEITSARCNLGGKS